MLQGDTAPRHIDTILIHYLPIGCPNTRTRLCNYIHTACKKCGFQKTKKQLLVTDFPTIHITPLANVRVFVLCRLCPLFSSLTDGLASFRVSGYVNLRRLWCRSHRQRRCQSCRREGHRGRSPQDELEMNNSLDTTAYAQILGPTARDASDRVTAIMISMLSLFGNEKRPRLPPSRVPQQDFYSRADRQRAHQLPPTLPPGVSPPCPSGTCMPTVVLRLQLFSQLFRLSLL